jgi:OmpA-OmpF porin, OOP family
VKSKSVIAILGLAAASFALPAAAQMRSPSLSSAYVGGSLGQSKMKFDCGGAATCDQTDTALRIFLGYQFTPNIAAEIGYADLGKSKIGDPSVPFSDDVKATAWDLSAVGLWPLANQFSILGRLGIFHGETKVSGTDDFKDTKTGVLWGLGGQFDLNKNLGFRAEWNRYSKMGGDNFGEKFNVDVFNVSALWRFQ